jgi:shikimate kinase
MPGSGKSYWGRKLASHYDLPFVDLDTCIEEKLGRTISAIFGTEGEMRFRKLESEALAEVLADERSLILGCGGGTVLALENRELMKQHGCMVYLQAPVRFLSENLRERAKDRPLLAGFPDLEERLGALLEQRKKVYELADYILPVRTVSLTNFDSIIEACIRKH